MGIKEWRGKPERGEGRRRKGWDERMGMGSCAPTEVFRSLYLCPTSNRFVRILIAVLEYNSAILTNFR